MNDSQANKSEKTILLVGAGSAHLKVLAHAAEFRSVGIRLVLIDGNSFYFMPNMTAEVMSGYYGLDDFHIDLKQLANKRNVQFVQDDVVGLLLQQKKVMTAAGRMIDYDSISFEIGSSPLEPEEDVPVEGRFSVLPIKNVLQIRNEIETLLELFPRKKIEIAVLGGGLSGLEYSINMAEILQQRKPPAGWKIVLVEAQPEILPGFPKRAIHIARKMLRVNDVEVRTKSIVQHIQSNRLVLEYGKTIDFDLAVVATGQKASGLFNHASLDTDEYGALNVSATLQSMLHPEVFACGDCAHVNPIAQIQSVAQAYQQGRLLVHNLRAQLEKKPLKKIKMNRILPRWVSLGNTNAMCLSGKHTFSGRGILLWKRWHERRLVRKLSR